MWNYGVLNASRFGCTIFPFRVSNKPRPFSNFAWNHALCTNLVYWLLNKLFYHQGIDCSLPLFQWCSVRWAAITISIGLNCLLFSAASSEFVISHFVNFRDGCVNLCLRVWYMKNFSRPPSLLHLQQASKGMVC